MLAEIFVKYIRRGKLMFGKFIGRLGDISLVSCSVVDERRVNLSRAVVHDAVDIMGQGSRR